MTAAARDHVHEPSVADTSGDASATLATHIADALIAGMHCGPFDYWI